MSEQVNGALLLQEHTDELAALDFVTWDRYVKGRWGTCFDYVSIYGWIDREGEYKDFVEIIYWDDGGKYFITSSAEYTNEIHEVLFDASPDEHNDCQRVENAVDIENVATLDE